MWCSEVPRRSETDAPVRGMRVYDAVPGAVREPDPRRCDRRGRLSRGHGVLKRGIGRQTRERGRADRLWLSQRNNPKNVFLLLLSCHENK